jgi:hypothetical protein
MIRVARRRVFCLDVIITSVFVVSELVCSAALFLRVKMLVWKYGREKRASWVPKRKSLLPFVADA